jgi:hypothetical protein
MNPFIKAIYIALKSKKDLYLTSSKIDYNTFSSTYNIPIDNFIVSLTISNGGWSGSLTRSRPMYLVYELGNPHPVWV